MNKFDPALHKRFSRYDMSVRRERPCVVTDRDIEILYALFIHGNLACPMIRALVSPNVSHKAVNARLRDLKRDSIPLIEWNPDQPEDDSAFLVYRITDAGIDLLLSEEAIEARHVRWRAGIFATKTHYRHEEMSSLTSASGELFCKERGFDYYSWLDVVDADECPQATKDAENPLAISFKRDGKDRTAITDGLCGIGTPEGVSYYVKEDDRNTTPKIARSDKRASYARHVADWRYIIGSDLYKKQWGIRNLQVLNVGIAPMRMQLIMEHLADETKARTPGLCGSNPFLFGAHPFLSPKRRKVSYEPKAKPTPPPLVKDQVFSGAWQRVGRPDFRLA